MNGGEQLLIELDANQRPDPDPAPLNQMIVRLRGAVLSDAYNIEAQISTAITEYFVPRDSGIKREIFREQLLRESLSFDKKIDLAKAVAVHFLNEDEWNQFATNLGQARTLRNAMAHYPSWLEVVKRDGTDLVVGYRAFLRKGAQTWEVAWRHLEASRRSHEKDHCHPTRRGFED
jgi:hypothetical protein